MPLNHHPSMQACPRKIQTASLPPKPPQESRSLALSCDNSRIAVVAFGHLQQPTTTAALLLGQPEAISAHTARIVVIRIVVVAESGATEILGQDAIRYESRDEPADTLGCGVNGGIFEPASL
jgi:hypothetical protein